MDSFPNLFLFVNKTAKSKSLSQSHQEEKFYIRSFVQSKQRKESRQSKQLARLKASNTTQAIAAQSTTHLPEQARNGSIISAEHEPDRPESYTPNITSAQADEFRQRLRYQSATRLPQIPLQENVMEPVRRASAPPDEVTFRKLKYYTSYVESTFKAESLDLTSEGLGTAFRHRGAIAERLQICAVDQVSMYATLACCASNLKWAVGEEDRVHPPEFYMVKAIEFLKMRLRNAPTVNSGLIFAIHTLCLSEMWSKNVEAATTHMRIILHLVKQAGGLVRLDSYVMESLLLGDKYLALQKFEAPILPLDWDPGPMPVERILEIQSEINPVLHRLGQEMFGYGLCTSILAIVTDMVLCMQAAHYIKSHNIQDDEKWLFLRHQALIYRLLSLRVETQIEECTRIALLVWILKVTWSFGTQRSLRHLLPRLIAALGKLDHDIKLAHLGLVFWINAMAAMAAEYIDERDWFMQQAASLAPLLGLELEKQVCRRFLQGYLFLPSEYGLQFFRMLRGIRDMELEARAAAEVALDVSIFLNLPS